MSTSPRTRAALLRDGDAASSMPARLDHDLRSPSLAAHGADARLVDPTLERAFEEAVTGAVQSGWKDGWTQGHQAGLVAGREEALTQARELAEARARSAEREQQQLQTVLSAFEQEAAALRVKQVAAITQDAPLLFETALELARILIGHEISAGRELGEIALQRALSMLPRGASDIQAHLHPDDIAAIPIDRVATTVRLVPDPDVPRGGCRARGADVEVDATLEAALERVREALIP